MSRQEIIERIDQIEENIFVEECKDRGYDFYQVREWRLELSDLRNMLKRMQ